MSNIYTSLKVIFFCVAVLGSISFFSKIIALKDLGTDTEKYFFKGTDKITVFIRVGKNYLQTFYSRRN